MTTTKHTHPFCPGCVRDMTLRVLVQAYLDSGPHYDMTEQQLAAQDVLVRALADAPEGGAGK